MYIKVIVLLLVVLENMTTIPNKQLQQNIIFINQKTQKNIKGFFSGRITKRGWGFETHPFS